ncbi:MULTISPECIES: YidH family protein [Micrococcaceae]|uniref:YidH family protein n=1 Tax=unclassified Kocuria TaxID=2649579 RepID=UPI0010118064|nr:MULTISPECIES: DUF202 domain-containing protein [unclassified Kocuria]
MVQSRFPRKVYNRGTEPDARFSLANERTFLAWIRTSLALVAAGVALEALDLPIHPDLRQIASLILVLLGLLAACLSFVRWARTERALRERRPLTGLGAGALLTSGVILGILGILVGLLL